MKKSLLSASLLFLTAVIWGFAMTAQRYASEFLSPFTFNGLRFVLGGMAMLPLLFREQSKRKEAASPASLNKRTLLGGGITGALLSIASILQQTGVRDSGAGVSGFLTALYVVLVPLLGIFIKKKTRAITWLSLVLALPALYLLCMKPGERFVLAQSDALVLLGAFFWAVHILATDHFVQSTSPIALCTVQFFSAALLSLLGALITERSSITLSNIGAAWGAVCYCGLLSTGLGYLLQTIGQKNCPPAFVALILSLESVFCVVSGVLLLQEKMTPEGAIGCGLMLLAVLIAQAGDLLAPGKEKRHV